jgi:hypothetical protein
VTTTAKPDPFGFDPIHIIDLRVEMASDNDKLPGDWPCEIVRRAAKLMQERAHAATKGRWCASPVYSPRSTATSAVYSHAHPAGSGESQVIASARVGKGGLRRGADAEHIAGLDPDTVDLIAAGWEQQADDMADRLAHFHAFGPPGNWVVEDEQESVHWDWTATVKAALTYLREDAPAVSV